MFHAILTMCKASLLYNIGVHSNFQVEKRAAFALFSNVNERNTENNAKTKKEMKRNGLQSHYTHSA
jgi:hypothetical protein